MTKQDAWVMAEAEAREMGKADVKAARARKHAAKEQTEASAKEVRLGRLAQKKAEWLMVVAKAEANMQAKAVRVEHNARCKAARRAIQVSHHAGKAAEMSDQKRRAEEAQAYAEKRRRYEPIDKD